MIKKINLIFLSILIGLVAETAFASPLSFYLDPYLGPQTGANNISSLYQLYGMGMEKLEALLPLEESQIPGKALGSACRILKGGVFDSFLAFFLSILNHEYFGHGGRYRMFQANYSELPHLSLIFRPRLSYYPPFYTLFDVGQAYFMSSLTQPPPFWYIPLFNGGGSEGNFILAEHLRKNMIKERKVDYYSSLLFLNARLDLTTYILFPTRNIMSGPPQGDIEHYLSNFNKNYGHDHPDDFILTAQDLKLRTLFVLGDPQIYLSLFSPFYYYFSGQGEYSLPLITIGQFSFLPYPGFQLSPFGCDFSLNFQGLWQEHFVSGTLRFGEPGINPFWGLGFTLEDLKMMENINYGLSFDFFVQPEEPLSANWNIGGAIELKGQMNLNPIALKANLGFKTKGYVPGLPFEAKLYGGLGLEF